MTLPRLVSSLFPLVAVVGTVAFTPALARADVSPRVADIAAKGNIPPAVPVEAGLGLGMVGGLLAVVMQRRGRKASRARC